MEKVDLSDRQRKWIAAGITTLAVSMVCAFAVGIGWVLLKALDLAAPALVPVIVGLFLSMFFKPYYGWFLVRLRNPTLSLAAMLLTVLVPAGVVLWCFGSMLAEQIAAFVTAAPTLITRMSAWFASNHPGVHAGLAQMGMDDSVLLFFTDPAKFSHDLIGQLGSEYGDRAVKAGLGAFKCLTGAVGVLLTAIFFVYFLMKPEVNGSDCARQMTFLKPETRAFVASQIDAFFDILVSFFQRQVVICLIEGLLYGLGFACVGLPYGFVIGFALGCLNLVPFLGTLVFLPTALLIAFFGDGGSAMRLLGVIGVWAAGQFADGYAITPLIQGKKTGLGFAGVIFSFFFWSAVFQPLLGLLLAIPLSAFCLVLWRALRDRYIKAVI